MTALDLATKMGCREIQDYLAPITPIDTPTNTPTLMLVD